MEHPLERAVAERLRELEGKPLERAVLEMVEGAYGMARQEGAPWPREVTLPFWPLLGAVLRGVGPALPYEEVSLLHALGLWRLDRMAYRVGQEAFRKALARPAQKPRPRLPLLPVPAPLLLFPEPLPVEGKDLWGGILTLDWDPRPPAHGEMRAVLWGEKGGRWQTHTLLMDLDAPTLAEGLARVLGGALSLREAEEEGARLAGSLYRLLLWVSEGKVKGSPLPYP